MEALEPMQTKLDPRQFCLRSVCTLSALVDSYLETRCDAAICHNIQVCICYPRSIYHALYAPRTFDKVVQKSKCSPPRHFGQGIYESTSSVCAQICRVEHTVGISVYRGYLGG